MKVQVKIYGIKKKSLKKTNFEQIYMKNCKLHRQYMYGSQQLTRVPPSKLWTMEEIGTVTSWASPIYPSSLLHGTSWTEPPGWNPPLQGFIRTDCMRILGPLTLQNPHVDRKTLLKTLPSCKFLCGRRKKDCTQILA